MHSKKKSSSTSISSLKHTDKRANTRVPIPTQARPHNAQESTSTHTLVDPPLGIPGSLAPFFQEYELAHLDLHRSASTIIERVLHYGDRSEIRWLFATYPRQQVVAWMRQWGAFALPEPHLTFWRLVLDLPEAGS